MSCVTEVTGKASQNESNCQLTSISTNGRNKKKRIALRVGYLHENPDLGLNAPKGYQWEIERLLNKQNEQDRENTMFWKTLESIEKSHPGHEEQQRHCNEALSFGR